MGTNWSEEEKDTAQQQAQPVHGSSPGAFASQQAVNTNSSSIVRSNSHRANEPKDARKVQFNNKLPHNCEAILDGNSDTPIDKSSVEKLYQQLQAGVYLNGRKKKYWVDKKGNNCFMMFANSLKITWAENPTNWYLHTAETSDHGLITVAQLRNVAWLEVHGRFHTGNLTPGVTYQVAFQIMLEYTSYGWEFPVNLRLTLPNGSKQEHKENLKDKPKGEWLRIPVGEFRASPENRGEIEFSLYEYEGGQWKKGLVLKSVIIEPRH